MTNEKKQPKKEKFVKLPYNTYIAYWHAKRREAKIKRIALELWQTVRKIKT